MKNIINQINLNISKLDEENKSLTSKLDEQLKLNKELHEKYYSLI